MQQKELVIKNKLGLHARAASKLVAIASKYKSSINLSTEKKTNVNGKSIMGVMTLAASQGTRISITIEGEDENELMEAIENLINKNFDEPE